MLYDLYKYVLIGPTLRARVHVAAEGVENIPRQGPVILASNHLAEVDSLVIALACPRKVAFLAKAEYFERPGLRGALARVFLRSTGQIPVRRNGGDDNALTEATEHLAKGRVWGVYPEGTRSPDGRLYRGHTGALRVAERVPDARVVPVGLISTDPVRQWRTPWYRGRIIVRFGTAIDPRPLVDSEGVRGATDHLMAHIHQLTGQQLHPAYAPLRTTTPTPSQE